VSSAKQKSECLHLYFQKVNNFGINWDKLLAGQRIKESFFEFYCIFYFSALQEKKAE
jgi:hypothetical protein